MFAVERDWDMLFATSILSTIRIRIIRCTVAIQQTRHAYDIQPSLQGGSELHSWRSPSPKTWLPQNCVIFVIIVTSR